MNYRSIADLSTTIRLGQHRFPKTLDLVVGIPRSGLLPASIIALNLNLGLCSLDDFLANRPIRHGRTRPMRDGVPALAGDARHVLVVDDSIYSGGTLDQTRQHLASYGGSDRKVTYCAIYATEECARLVDIAMEVIKSPLLFEWNLMHNKSVAKYCVDIDGVLCLDPTQAQNDDGANYLEFLRTASPLAGSSFPIGHLVTSRLERYRAQTVDWLHDHGVEFEHLHMLDLPDAATRRRLGAHAPFKAEVYRSLETTMLFIESEEHQAETIAQISGKPVLCYTNQKIYREGLSVRQKRRLSNTLIERVSRRLRRAATRLKPLTTDSGTARR
jgi:uncharacterized HAD superfamily protein